MESHGSEEIRVPKLDMCLTFNRQEDFLGKGTVGEVFRTRLLKENEKPSTQACYALKIFLDRGERPHFARECRVLEALALVPHPNIQMFLHYWTDDGFQYMLFPLAAGDLFSFFRTSEKPKPNTQFIRWFVEQLLGLCDALKYIHNYTMSAIGSNGSDNDRIKMHRIGFHHDIKPVNILLFETGVVGQHTWKLSDFGSGIVSEFRNSDHESIYNSKPSTGDPIYTAPEFALEGKVSRPKDVWSLGCIYLEALIWVSDPSRTAIDDFQQARFGLPGGRIARKPMYWYQDESGEARVHPAVRGKMDALNHFCKNIKPLGDVHVLVDRMLTVHNRRRATAAELCDGFMSALDTCSKLE